MTTDQSPSPASPLPEGRADVPTQPGWIVDAYLSGYEDNNQWALIDNVSADDLRADLQVAIKRLMAHVAAPAVPVGVQPEPAEEARRGCACHGDIYCGAVPVVHPEPGDRAELMPEGVADFQLAVALFPLLLLWLDEDDETIDEYTITRAAINHLRQRPPAEFALLFPSQVAAAVAAVRADRDRLAGQVAAIRALHGKVPEPFLDGERYSCSTCTDGEGNAIDWPCPTLVASSPTTPEAPK